MEYIELTAAVAPADAERAADVLRVHAGAGVSIESPFIQRSLELGAELRGHAHAFVRAYVARGRAMPALMPAFCKAGIVAQISQRVVAEEDWAESWKEHFHVERFGRVVVVPSWREYAPQPHDVIVTLDPGMAFGTGQHETTRTCLEALDRHIRPGVRMLDVGCGSGILAIAAAKLGAADVLAIDIDADCVRITGENAALNGAEAIVHARMVAGEARPFGDAAAGNFDIIAANIVASTIIDLAPAFAAALASGGRLIASGIIAAREREACDALIASGLRVEGVHAMGEWRCIEAAGTRGAAR